VEVVANNTNVIMENYKKMLKRLTLMPENEVELIELKDFND
jgi:hypothetical protein